MHNALSVHGGIGSQYISCQDASLMPWVLHGDLNVAVMIHHHEITGIDHRYGVAIGVHASTLSCPTSYSCQQAAHYHEESAENTYYIIYTRKHLVNLLLFLPCQARC